MTALHRIHPPAFLLLALACALPLASSGCSQRACFFWTKAEGTCPAREDAVSFFTNSSCDSPIESVDSDPEYDGELCCYDVTERSSEEVLCNPSVPDTKPPGSSGGMVPNCEHCSSFVNNALIGIPPNAPCAGSEVLFETVRTCMCSGVCQSACSDSVCATAFPATTACLDCATDSAVGCGNEFSACLNDK